jgi:hypothetical protein
VAQLKKNGLFLECSNRIYEIIESYGYLISVRKEPKDFSRVGKMGFKNMILFILNFSTKTLQAELNAFFKNIHATRDGVRKQAFSQGRQKILPEAFIILHEELIKTVYTATDLNLYKGYRVSAIDGSTVELQNTEELRNVFGYSENGRSKVARARISGLYDVENNIMIDAIIDNYNTPEKDFALRHIEKLKNYGLHNDLILFDRGYPSKDLMARLIDNEIQFVMRCSTSFFKKVNNVKGNDEEITFRHTGYDYTIRVVKFALNDATEEILVTNVFDKSLTVDDFKVIYFKRWGIEIKYDELKQRLQLENFDGVKEIAVRQDFYATIFLANMAALAKMQSDQIIQKKNEEKELKHQYKTNVNIMVSELKDELILIMMEQNEKKRKRRYNNLLQEIARNVIPIRPERHNARTFKKSRDRYPMNARRGL